MEKNEKPINHSEPVDKAEREAYERKKFLESLESTSCGRGRHDCNGSEETCTCN